MSIEDINVGCFQIILLFLLGINYIIVAMSHTLTIYHNYTPKFYCETSDGLNKTYGCINNTYVNNTLGEINKANSFKICTTNEYNFLTENGEKSIVTDWGLICERSYLKEYSIVAYCVGVSIGAWIAGILVDRIGRLPVLAICLYSQGTMAVATYIVQSYPVFLALRGLQGVFAQGLQTSTYILALELFPTKLRTLVSSVMGVAWALGLLLLTGLSYVIPDWRILQLAVSVPTAVTVLYIWVIPDSSRWLLARNKTTEADITLEKIIKYNNCCLGSKARRELVDSENVTPVKSDRKSRIFSDSNEKSNTDEAVNLLTPTTSTNRNSRISLRVISQNLEKRLSNPTETFIQVTENIPNIDSSEIFEPAANENSTEIRIIENKLDLDEQTVVIEQKESTEIIESLPEEKPVKKTFCSFKNGCLIKYISIITCQWLSVSTMNSLMSYLLPSVVQHRHINSTINALVELFIYIGLYFVLSKHGRRLPIIILQIFNFIICLLIAILVFLPFTTLFLNDLIRTILLLFGRVTALSTLATIYLYTSELFPTVIRGTCLGLFIIISTIGGISGPYILILVNNLSGPLIFIGSFSLASAILCFLLPETIDHCLPDHLKDMNNLKCDKSYKINVTGSEDKIMEQEILREKLFSEDWVDAGNGIIVNFTENKN
ncbi:organic cation transporter protein [Microplitis demolitor]|uniref:organic cation transporter protein n=1 Tax=Microplitis demolitor TaxID=69319 RepID=UPI0004CDD065|nr:organic cation transporter protein [Microplitis demolitor]